MNEKKQPFFDKPCLSYSPLRETVNDAYRMDEAVAVKVLLEYINFSASAEQEIHDLAEKLVFAVRDQQVEQSAVEAFMLQYDLSMEEGILMMCLAEALLRIPDKETERLLLRDKLSTASWSKHVGASESSMVNMATRGLVLSGKILREEDAEGSYFKSLWGRMLRRSGEPVIRKAVREAMKILSKQFVIGRNIQEALKQSAKLNQKGYYFSYDMLGEVALTQKDADRYYQAYFDAITALGAHANHKDIIPGPGISVKLSALHPRYEFAQREYVVPYLINRVKMLLLHAKENNISFTVDAEEVDRLDISLEIIQALFVDPDFKGWEGLGLALQAYQKRAFYLIDWLVDLARSQKKRIQVRLVKGAYWDTEVKLSQVEGFNDYPVFTRKNNTDLSYLACVKKLLLAQDAIYPQFATHNAYSVAAISSLIESRDNEFRFEFQSLQGMGRALHDQLVSKTQLNYPCRIYAPVGSHEDLLPYLVRRLLENGANSSFVNRISDKNYPVAKLVASPIEKVKSYTSIANPNIPLPKNIFGEVRVNSMGLDIADHAVLKNLAAGLVAAETKSWLAPPLLAETQDWKAVINPADHHHVVGKVCEATAADAKAAMQQASEAFYEWQQSDVGQRADILRKTADLLESHIADFIYLAIREAGKTLHDAVSEVREAVDFCRYYAERAEKTLADEVMPGPTGELNILRMRGRGVIVCISPWNFPLAIFLGQISAALVTGNTVVAKPAPQTPLISALAVSLFYQAGLPERVLRLLPGPGDTVGEALVNHAATAGVMFTGSNATSKKISQALANRPGAIVPLIAETGGMNAMITDSTALKEQLVADVVMSAFGSAGQRCSALRVLFVQADIADDVIEMLAGAMAELHVGDPMWLATDVGPVIDKDAKQRLLAHCERMQREAKLIYRTELPADANHGCYVAPQAYELSSLSQLTQEVFGPILHVVRYELKDLDRVIDEINQLGYGLTFGVQSRINEKIAYIEKRMQVGNIYVNRNMIGAVVGVQPFGGSRLSGTGPKAGGPHYLPRLCQECTISIDTTAVGGNASLMAMEEED